MRSRFLFWGLLFLLLSSGPIHAQSVWVRPADRTSAVSVEWLKPVFSDESPTFFSSSLVVSGQARLADRLMLVGEIPLTYVRGRSEGQDPKTVGGPVEGSEQERSGASVGNPYVGIELYGTSAPFFVELGVRLPVAKEPDLLPALVGSLIDLNRVGAYAVDLMPLQLVGNYRHEFAGSNVSVRLRGGPETYLPTSEYGSGGMVLTYGAQGWYHGEQVEVGLGGTGRWAVTQTEVGFRESSLHQITGMVRGTFGRLQPGVMVRVPLSEELRDAFPVVVGASLSVSLSGKS